MAQVNLCYEDPTKISNIEILLLDTYEAYSRYSEADAMVSQSRYGQFAFSPKCNYSALKAKSVEAGISFINYYLSRNRQIILRHHEQVDKHNQLLENPHSTLTSPFAKRAQRRMLQ